MALPGTDELMLINPRLRPGNQFLAGFDEGFGFAGLFAKFDQEPLPFADATQTEAAYEFDEELVDTISFFAKHENAKHEKFDEDVLDILALLEKYERASLRGKGHSPKGTVPARAAK